MTRDQIFYALIAAVIVETGLLIYIGQQAVARRGWRIRRDVLRRRLGLG